MMRHTANVLPPSTAIEDLNYNVRGLRRDHARLVVTALPGRTTRPHRCADVDTAATVGNLHAMKEESLAPACAHDAHPAVRVELLDDALDHE